MTHTSLSPGLVDNPIVREQWEKSRLTRFWLDGSMTLHVGEPLIEFEREMFSIFPAVGAYGTISDLQKFVKALLPDENGYSPLFENAETLARMFSVSHEPPGSMGLPRVIRHGFTDENPALGWIAPDETLQIGYGGIGPFGFTYFIADIENGVGLVLLSNVDISGVFVPGQEFFFSEVVRLVFGE